MSLISFVTEALIIVHGIRTKLICIKLGTKLYFTKIKVSKYYLEKGYLIHVMVHQQINFITLSSFCLLSKTLFPTLVLNWNRQSSWMDYQTKLNENTDTFYIAFQVLNVNIIINFFNMQSRGLLFFIALHRFLHQQISYFTTF